MMTSLAPGRGADHGHRDLHLHGRPRRHLPLRVRDRPRDAGADGPVRRPHRAPGRRHRVAHDDHAYDRADSAFTTRRGVHGPALGDRPVPAPGGRAGKSFNLTNYKARYWLINGRGYPDSIADNGASWLPEPALRVARDGAALRLRDPPLPGMARYLNVGSEDYPFHPHGNNGLVIGRDGHALKQRVRRTTSRWRSSRSTSAPARPGTCCSSGTTPRTTARRTRCRWPCRASRTRWSARSTAAAPTSGSTQALPPGVADPQPVRRVLHHLAQPRAVPDHLLGRDDDRPDHVHADRPAQPNNCG